MIERIIYALGTQRAHDIVIAGLGIFALFLLILAASQPTMVP